jgi:hypothetical protein
MNRLVAEPVHVPGSPGVFRLAADRVEPQRAEGRGVGQQQRDADLGFTQRSDHAAIQVQDACRDGADRQREGEDGLDAEFHGPLRDDRPRVDVAQRAVGEVGGENRRTAGQRLHAGSDAEAVLRLHSAAAKESDEHRVRRADCTVNESDAPETGSSSVQRSHSRTGTPSGGIPRTLSRTARATALGWYGFGPRRDATSH